MNVGYEEEELKPYIEPQPDYKDPRRTGRHRNTTQKMINVIFSLAAYRHTDVLFLHSTHKVIYLKENYGPAGSSAF